MPKQVAPPTFPPKCRNEGHDFTEMRGTAGRKVDVRCKRCGIDTFSAGYWMSKALSQEVKATAPGGVSDD